MTPRLFALGTAALLLSAPTVHAAEELSVTVYEGPTECDRKVTAGDQLSMHYTGTIDASSKTGEAGKQFDSSRTRGQTFDFAVGTGSVIKGWDDGVGTMKLGERCARAYLVYCMKRVAELQATTDL